jgi:formylglycine-generating enzyme required for sulfatase activity/pimeloyl-ACP methyl ester carboxylesterase
MAELIGVGGCDNERRVGDVIFVHGLNGDACRYWCRDGDPRNYWPGWLSQDLPAVGVWSLKYDNAAFSKRRLSILGRVLRGGFAMPLSTRAKNVILALVTAEVDGRPAEIGKRPIVFIAHSMGGLLVKQMLRAANDSRHLPEWAAILEKTRGVCFIATPHIGADLAKWADYFRALLGPTIATRELEPHHPGLLDLNTWYSDYVTAPGVDIKTLSFYEDRALAGVGRVVEPGDANPGVPRAECYPLDDDHRSICKPTSTSSLIHRKVRRFIIEGIPDTATEMAEARPGQLADDRGEGRRDQPWPRGCESPPVVPGPTRSMRGLIGAAIVVTAVLLVFLGLSLQGLIRPGPNRQPLAHQEKARRIAPGKFDGTLPGEERDDNKLKMSFCWCPPGTFRMGDPERTSASVTLTGFWMGKHEVTQDQWQKVMNTSVRVQRKKSKHDPRCPGLDDKNAPDTPVHPIFYVNYIEATEFCSRFTAAERQSGKLPAGCKLRLPTEAEWEYACRADPKASYSSEDEVKNLVDYAWYGKTGGSPHPVGLKRPNRWNIHDMYGNVFEWCEDGYSDELRGGLNPRGPSRAAQRIIRGGCWDSDPQEANATKCKNRHWEAGSCDVGFRVVLVGPDG